MRRVPLVLPLLVAAVLATAPIGCRSPTAAPRGEASAVPGAPEGSARPPLASGPTSPARSAATKPPAVDGAEPRSPRVAPLPATEFARLFRDVSEPGERFISDNTISNETSYLQVAPALASRPSGGAYVGVGPEQNFTYIGLLAPELAFIVDIRRDNALLHLLYRAIFERARSRAEFLALLLGRPFVEAGDPGSNGDIDAVITHAVMQAPDPHHCATVDQTAWAFLTKDLELELTTEDRVRLEQIHSMFYRGQLDLRFALREPNGREYPSLRELLRTVDSGGRASNFLGSHAAFARVQELERANRVIPIVGDFAGQHAFPRIAADLRSRGLKLSALYVSNVEQYLLDPEHWPRWVANVGAFPARDDATFVRCYLDQGRAHPAQLTGHRTATVLQPLASFLARQRVRPYSTFWQVATDG
ncbi:MAG: hypothetical protein JW751_25605 [Polyangiaceae bacterium]|nr:hypothetical protein [Polyangiaceae bacterium]